MNICTMYKTSHVIPTKLFLWPAITTNPPPMLRTREKSYGDQQWQDNIDGYTVSTQLPAMFKKCHQPTTCFLCKNTHQHKTEYSALGQPMGRQMTSTLLYNLYVTSVMNKNLGTIVIYDENHKDDDLAEHLTKMLSGKHIIGLIKNKVNINISQSKSEALFSKRTDVLPRDLVNPRNRGIRV